MNPDFLYESLIWLLLSVGLFASGFFIGKLVSGGLAFWAGYHAGRNEERSHTNALVMQARLQAFQDGRALTYQSRN